MSSPLLTYQQSLVYEGDTTLARWREDARVLRSLDLRAERLRRQWLWTNVAVGLVLAFAVFVVIANEDLPRGARSVVLGFPATLLVIGLIRHATVKRLDVENRRYELVDALLGLLARDMKKDAGFFLRLDLLPPTHDSKARVRSQRDGWNISAYTDPWLTLRGRLLDGSRFSLTVRDHLEVRKRWKKTARGKMKLKEKRREGLSASLKVRPDDERLAPLRARTEALPRPKLPDAARVEGLRLDEDAVVLEGYLRGRWATAPGGVGEAEVSALDFLTATFVGVYRLIPERRR